MLDLNRFGNVQLNVRSSHRAPPGSTRRAGRGRCRFGRAVVKRVSTYADLAEGEWGLIVDPRGWLSVVRGNPANAAEALGVGSDDLVWLTRQRH